MDSALMPVNCWMMFSLTTDGSGRRGFKIHMLMKTDIVY
jgi:hypothetical protein